MSRFALLGGNHTSALRDYSYERYVDDEMEVDVVDDCISIEVFRSRNPPSVLPPATNPTYSLNYPVKGAVATIDYKCPVTPDPTKKLILSIIRGAESVMDIQKCYAAFTSQNIVVTHDGKALFKHLRLVPLTDNAKIVVYKSIGTFITDLFQDYPIPADIQHLIDLLKSGRKQALYRIHSSVVPHSDRGWQFLLAYEYVMHRADSVSKDLILLALPYLEIWRKIVYLNLVLIETYEYSAATYKEDPPVDEFGNPIPWSENAKKVQSAKKFMDFIRNGTSHRLQRSIRLSADEYETILLVLFHMLLPKLLEAMFDHLHADGLEKAGLLR